MNKVIYNPEDKCRYICFYDTRDKVYISSCVDVPEIRVKGATLKHALYNAKRAVRCILKKVEGVSC